MKIFCVLTIFISLSIAGLGIFLIVETVLDGALSYFAAAKIVVGSILALVGITLFLAFVAVAVSDKIYKHRRKKKGDKK